MDIVKSLLTILPKERISTNVTILEQHSKDESYHEAALPDVVVFPESTTEVAKVVKLAGEHKIPLIPFGFGSSLEGHVIPYNGGITIDFSNMNRILEVKPNDFLVRVQPGVTRTQLNKELKKYGLFFSVDPGADATLGGMAATNASGTTTVRYGTMRDQVRDLEVVLPNGDIIHTGNLAAKSSSGYHLNGIFVGSEGTLGCFTELTLRVFGIPEEVMAARATFDTIDKAVDAVISVLSAGIQIARVELVDEQSIIQVNKTNKTNYEVLPTLFLEFQGNKAGLEYDVAFMEEIVADIGVHNITFEQDTQARNALWEARHHLAYSYIHGFPGKKMMVTDVCLPYSELAGGIRHARKTLEMAGLDGGIVGHVGDGNYHVLLMINTGDGMEVEKANAFNAEIVRYALERGGTCTGEHGVGVGKQMYQKVEHGKALDLMTTIKRAIDPNHIFNPGKIFP